MSIPCYKCGHILEHSWSTCPNCQLIKSQHQAAQSIIDANQRAADRAESDKFWEGVYAEKAEAENRAAILGALQNVQDKLEEMRQESIKDSTAHAEGYKFAFLENYPNASQGSLNEWGAVKNLYFTPPYRLKRLNDAYVNGAFDRIKEVIGDDYLIAGADELFFEQAYEAAINGLENFKFCIKIPQLSDLEFSTPSYKGTSFWIDRKTGEVAVKNAGYKFERDDLNHIYQLGTEEFLAAQNQPEMRKANIVRLKQERNKALLEGLKEIWGILTENRPFKLFICGLAGAIAAYFFLF